MNKLKKNIREYKAQIILFTIFIILVLIGYEYYNNYFMVLKDPNKVKKIIMSYGDYSLLAFILLQIIQVLAFFIPGEIVQIAGGFIYGTLYGGIVSLIGITLGSIIAYSIAHIYGKPLLNKIIDKKNFKFFDKILNMGEINHVVFLLYLIPGIPKDALAYICGVSRIGYKDFFIYSTLGRLPGIFISAFFGAKIHKGNNVLLIGIAVVMTILFFIGIYKGDKIIKYLVKKKS